MFSIELADSNGRHHSSISGSCFRQCSIFSRDCWSSERACLTNSFAIASDMDLPFQWSLKQNDDIAVLVDLDRICRHAAAAIMQSLAGDDVELPAVPGAAKDAIGERRIECVNMTRTMRRVN